MAERMERRDFLKVLGVAGTGATLAGCTEGPEKLIPYVVQPEEIVPGVATWYAPRAANARRAAAWRSARERDAR